MIKRKQKIRLHLLNHDYSNMNNPYINENLFAFITVQNNIYIPTECVRSTVSIDAPPPNFVAILLVNANWLNVPINTHDGGFCITFPRILPSRMLVSSVLPNEVTNFPWKKKQQRGKGGIQSVNIEKNKKSDWLVKKNV